MHIHDGTAPIEANDDQEENNSLDGIDDEHAVGADPDDSEGELDDVNGNGRLAHATEDSGVGRDMYSFDAETPPGPLGRTQASEPGSDVPALEPTGSSSPQREVDGVQGPATPPAAVGDMDLSTFTADDDWMQQYPMESFDATGNSDLDALLYAQQCQRVNAPGTGQPCPTGPGMCPKPQLGPYPTMIPFARRRRLDPAREALMANKMREMRLQAENLKKLVDRVARGYTVVS